MAPWLPGSHAYVRKGIKDKRNRHGAAGKSSSEQY